MVSLGELHRPFVVGVVAERTVARAERSAALALAEGADVVELNLASLPEAKLPGRDFFKRLRRPVYTSSRRAPFMEVYGHRFARLKVFSDEVRMARQLAMLAEGSAGLDIEADTFAPDTGEWTNNRTAIRRQGGIVTAAHREGRAVIYSWHPPGKLTLAAAWRAAAALRDRGADFVKIVERVRSVDEALDTVRISLHLRASLDFPFVFLPLGPGAEQVRRFMPAFGAAYLLARPSAGSNCLPAQPLVASARALLDSL